MQTSTKKIYSSFNSALDINVSFPIADTDKTMDAMRESMKNILNAKNGVSGGQRMEIQWQVDGKYHKETVTT